MKKILSSTLIGLLVAVFSGLAQDCTFFYPLEKGTLIELKHYNRKGKLSGSTLQEIVDKQTSGGAIRLTIDSKFFDDKGEEIMTSELNMECKDGVFTFDMDQYLNDEMLAGMKDMDFRIEGDFLQYPANMNPGDELKEGTIRLIVPEMSMMNMTTRVYNRKVEAIESISTEAGTFECYKISYDVFTDAMIDIQTKGIEWIAQEAGAVRSEMYNKRGKLTGYSELVRLEK